VISELAALLGEVLAAERTLGATRLMASVDGNDQAALGFAARRGFALIQQMRTMVLDVAAFDMSSLPALAERAERQGYRVISFAEAGDTTENRRRLYELINLLN
jgi:hypothetical protein